MKKAEIVAILGKLPLAPRAEACISACAEEVVVAAKVGDVLDFGAGIEGRRRRFAKDLEQFAQHGLKLQFEILRMHPLALTAINEEAGDDVPPMAVFEKQLGLMAELARQAALRLDAAPMGGRPRANTVARVAESVRRAYELLTGKPATVRVDPKTAKAYGPFVGLMDEIFRALEIDASPEAQAKAALKEKTPRERD